MTHKRIAHVLMVAQKMQEKAKELGWEEEKCKEMYVLGLNHDVGYQFENGFNHNVTGGKILKQMGFKYYKEVASHGVPNCNYQSKELDLLNWADCHTTADGRWVSMEQDLEDIEIRRGKDSKAYIDSVKMVKELKQKGWK